MEHEVYEATCDNCYNTKSCVEINADGSIGHLCADCLRSMADAADRHERAQ